MRIAYLHGLESKAGGPKNLFLRKHFNKIYDPDIDYRNPDVWDNIYNDLIRFKPNYIVGSSMGGWFAYNLGKKMGIPTLLFNPALQGRSIEPEVDTTGTKKPKNTLVLGDFDKVINPIKTIETIKSETKNYKLYKESITHRIPMYVFEKYILSMKKGEL